LGWPGWPAALVLVMDDFPPPAVGRRPTRASRTWPACTGWNIRIYWPPRFPRSQARRPLWRDPGPDPGLQQPHCGRDGSPAACLGSFGREYRLYTPPGIARTGDLGRIPGDHRRSRAARDQRQPESLADRRCSCTSGRDARIRTGGLLLPKPIRKAADQRCAMPDLRSIVSQRPPASVVGDGDSYSLGYSASFRTFGRPAVTFTSAGSSAPAGLTCGASWAHTLTCEEASRQFSSFPAALRGYVPWMCPRKLVARKPASAVRCQRPRRRRRTEPRSGRSEQAEIPPAENIAL
jgi:hypothetical protein